MRIFGLIIMPKKKLTKLISKTYDEGFESGENFTKGFNNAWIQPVLSDLEKLRANTWDQNKITKIQHWLKGMLKTVEGVV